MVNISDIEGDGDFHKISTPGNIFDALDEAEIEVVLPFWTWDYILGLLENPANSEHPHDKPYYDAFVEAFNEGCEAATNPSQDVG